MQTSSLKNMFSIWTRHCPFINSFQSGQVLLWLTHIPFILSLRNSDISLLIEQIHQKRQHVRNSNKGLSFLSSSLPSFPVEIWLENSGEIVAVIFPWWFSNVKACHTIRTIPYWIIDKGRLIYIIQVSFNLIPWVYLIPRVYLILTTTPW